MSGAGRRLKRTFGSLAARRAAVANAIDARPVANAAADLNRQFRESLDDTADHLGVDRFSGERTVQIHQMQATRAGLDPTLGHGHRVVREDRRVFHPPLAQPHALTVFQINRGYEQHSKGST